MTSRQKYMKSLEERIDWKKFEKNVTFWDEVIDKFGTEEAKESQRERIADLIVYDGRFRDYIKALINQERKQERERIKKIIKDYEETLQEEENSLIKEGLRSAEDLHPVRSARGAIMIVLQELDKE